METLESEDITQILHEWNDGDEDAVERLLPVVYNELKYRARYLLARERSDHTLQPTALVHEAFIKISNQPNIEWKNRKHFYRIVSRLMRQVLVDYARKKSSLKRGNKAIRFSLDDVQVSTEEKIGLVLSINDALDNLAEIDKRQHNIVEMRFFGGLSNTEIAEALDVSVRTVVREWKLARIWLLMELG